MKTNFEIETCKHPKQISFLPLIGIDVEDKFIVFNFLIWSVFFTYVGKKANQRNS